MLLTGTVSETFTATCRSRKTPGGNSSRGEAGTKTLGGV